MCTKHRDLFASLAAPFARAEVKTRPQGNRQLAYVTARTIMNRLDAVIGPENWWDEYQPLEKSVICRLTLRLPGGELVTKSDAGGYAGMADAGDDDKSGFSDAFKRTAVKFGVGRYLYNDGVANLTEAPPAPAQASAAAAASAPLSPPCEGGARGGGPVAPAAPVPAPAPASTELPKQPAKIKTGYQLHQYAINCAIDPCLKGWIVGYFPKQKKFPVKIEGWSQAQVAEALPTIRTHLEEILATKQKVA
jgi:hypothetical protein